MTTGDPPAGDGWMGAGCDVLRRWEHEAQGRLQAGCDNRVVASFGANDALRCYPSFSGRS